MISNNTYTSQLTFIPQDEQNLPNQAMVIWNPQSQSYTQQITEYAIEAIGGTIEALGKIPEYLMRNVSEEEKAAQRLKQELESLSKQIAEARSQEMLKQKAFNDAFQIAAKSQVQALICNSEAFSALHQIRYYLLEYKKENCNTNFEVPFSQHRLPPSLPPASPFYPIIQSLDFLIDSHTKEREIPHDFTPTYPEIEESQFLLSHQETSQLLLNNIQAFYDRLINDRDKRINATIEEMIAKAENIAKTIPSSDNFSSLELVNDVFEVRLQLEHFIRLDLMIIINSHKKNFECQKIEESKPTSTSYLGWVWGSSSTIEEYSNPLPEDFRKMQTHQYNEAAKKAHDARIDFQDKMRILKNAYENLRNAQTFLHSLNEAKGKLEDPLFELNEDNEDPSTQKYAAIEYPYSTNPVLKESIQEIFDGRSVVNGLSPDNYYTPSYMQEKFTVSPVSHYQK